MKRIREFLKLVERFRSTPIVDEDFTIRRDESDFAMGKLSKLLTTIPEIICLCGSTRFIEAFQKAEFQLTLQGKIVLTIGCDTKSEGDLFAGPEGATIKSRLDELHKRKIDISDRVLVLNVGGYIGDSTKSEIQHAERIGVPVSYLEPI